MRIIASIICIVALSTSMSWAQERETNTIKLVTHGKFGVGLGMFNASPNSQTFGASRFPADRAAQSQAALFQGNITAAPVAQFGIGMHGTISRYFGLQTNIMYRNKGFLQEDSIFVKEEPGIGDYVFNHTQVVHTHHIGFELVPQVHLPLGDKRSRYLYLGAGPRIDYRLGATAYGNDNVHAKEQTTRLRNTMRDSSSWAWGGLAHVGYHAPSLFFIELEYSSDFNPILDQVNQSGMSAVMLNIGWSIF